MERREAQLPCTGERAEGRGHHSSKPSSPAGAGLCPTRGVPSEHLRRLPALHPPFPRGKRRRKQGQGEARAHQTTGRRSVGFQGVTIGGISLRENLNRVATQRAIRGVGSSRLFSLSRLR